MRIVSKACEQNNKVCISGFSLKSGTMNNSTRKATKPVSRLAFRFAANSQYAKTQTTQ